MTAAELLAIGDSDFCALLGVWAEHREPPIALVDLLIERNCDSAAKVVEWVLRQPLRPVFLETKECKPFPLWYENDQEWDGYVI